MEGRYRDEGRPVKKKRFPGRFGVTFPAEDVTIIFPDAVGGMMRVVELILLESMDGEGSRSVMIVMMLPSSSSATDCRPRAECSAVVTLERFTWTPSSFNILSLWGFLATTTVLHTAISKKNSSNRLA